MFPSASFIGRGGGLDVDKVFATQLQPSNNQPNVKRSTPFEPDLVWNKARQSSYKHLLYDSLRPSNLALSTNDAQAQESIGTGYGGIVQGGYNDPGVASTTANWIWKRAKKFFDIVTYTGNGVAGRQIPHGLGVKPGMIAVKAINANGYDWPVYHQSRSSSRRLFLNLSNAEDTNSVFFSEPTETAYFVSDNVGVNAPGIQYVAYLFAHDPSPSGIIQCGQYTGNGSTTGPVVTLGWEPQLLLIKAASRDGSWVVLDNKRSPNNPRGQALFANLSSEEFVGGSFLTQFLANGFQIATTGTEVNSNTHHFIYLAIRKGKA